ncbi:MAG: VWA domain-containing protein [bacterium]|nr:VWA domain-containing protein [bacterium]
MRKISTAKLAPLAVLLTLTALAASEPATTQQESSLRPRHQRWLEDVELLMSDAEREVFLGLREDYQREDFIRRFWRVRDPYPRTARNEFRESWEERVRKARELYGELGSERAEMLLHFDEPTRQVTLTCPSTRTLEVWYYDQGSDRITGYFTLVFVGARGAGRLWQPGDSLRDVFAMGEGIGLEVGAMARLIERECTRSDDILAALAQSLDVRAAMEKGALYPRPSDEWVRAFKARSTDVGDDVERLAGELRLSFPGRHQSRTVVQALVRVPRTAVSFTEVGEHRSYNLLIDGNVLRRGELFDDFRYRFNFPAEQAPAELPLVVQRYLRPGRYRLIVKVEDLGSQRVYREERELEVPRIEVALATPPAAPPSEGSVAAAAPAAPPAVVETQLAEANASISTGDHTIKLLAVPDLLTVGKLRVEARTQGEGIERVAFELNGRPIMRKSRPPYSVELNLGDKPRVHTLRAVALDADGGRLAVDEVLVNAGPHRFSTRLIEPQAGKRYRSSVRAHAEVEVPEAERLDRVEFYLNETLVATLYQPPFEQPLLLPAEAELAYVRAVAYLSDGNSSEDVVFINAPDFIDELRVDFVELYTTVVDRKGSFVEELRREEVTVIEDGTEQEIRRFEKVRDLPIRAGLVIDTSTSMLEVVPDVRRAAHRFLETVLTPRDRAALITFADQPELAVRFTSDQEVLAGGLAGLVAEGETALYDTIIFALHYFSGLRGKRAIIILTDGEDSCSTYTFEDAIDFARRTGVAIYVVGLEMPTDHLIYSRMLQLARETGGDCIFIDRVSELTKVYESIQEELRSQYLIAYQSSQAKDGDAFRRVEVKIRRKGLEAKTIRGYHP